MIRCLGKFCQGNRGFEFMDSGSGHFERCPRVAKLKVEGIRRSEGRNLTYNQVQDD